MAVRRPQQDAAKIMDAGEALELVQRRQAELIDAHWIDWATERGHLDREGNFLYTHRAVKELGERGLRTLLYLADSGDREAAKYLVDRSLGLPELPLSLRVPNMSLAESEQMLAEIMRRRHLQPETVQGFLEALAAPAVEGE